ncbi:MAG: translation initiation factor [Bacteroidota bacterium]
MAKKKKDFNERVVYSTNSDFNYEDEYEEPETLPPGEQKLKVQREKKGRGGKEVTIVSGFVGTEEDLKALGKTLKKSCGVGGSVKDDEIIIQGNHAENIVELLQKQGYQAKKSGG